jgi:hypothetical protein
MNPSMLEGRQRRARPVSVRPRLDSRLTKLKPVGVAGFALVAGVLLGSCSYLERGRQIADIAVATAHQANLAALVEAQEERIRVRKSRCYNPMLTPATIADAALDPRLGLPWVEELLRDCPKFAAFIAQLVVSRARVAGVVLPSSETP